MERLYNIWKSYKYKYLDNMWKNYEISGVTWAPHRRNVVLLQSLAKWNLSQKTRIDFSLPNTGKPWANIYFGINADSMKIVPFPLVESSLVSSPCRGVGEERRYTLDIQYVATHKCTVVSSVGTQECRSTELPT